MFHVLYLQTTNQISLNLKMGISSPNENEVHNFYSVVRRFNDDPNDIPAFLEQIFIEMQGEKWSPNGGQRQLIEETGAGHTSMSAGDLVYDDKRNVVWICKGSGFEELRLKDLGTDEEIVGATLIKLLPLNSPSSLVKTTWIVPPALTALEQFMKDGESIDWVC